ncbi:MAG: Hsp20/alpha crystallin family protein [Nitrospiraceae bacterium]
MALVRWDPFRELEDMSERLNRVFARPALHTTGGKEHLTVADWIPTVDISESDGEYLIKAELPEVKKEDVKVTVEDGVLTLQGERRQEKEEKGKRFHRVERSYGSFVRSFTLPESVDEGAVRAEYKDGMLNLHLPKTEKVKPKAIDVKVA